MSRLILITSGKGGVGKTTSAINLGASLNLFGKNVVIVDANLTTPNVGLHFGAPVVPVSLNNVLAGENELKEAIYEHNSGTKILPASISLIDLKKASFSKLASIAKKLKRTNDFVIFDSPAGLGDEVITVFDSADELLVVTNAELPAITDALKAIKTAENMGKSITGVIVTRKRDDNNELSLADIENLLERNIIGVIPEDMAVKQALMKKDAVVHTHPKSRASLAYKQIAAKLIGRKYAPPQETFFEKIFSVIGLK